MRYSSFSCLLQPLWVWWLTGKHPRPRATTTERTGTVTAFSPGHDLILKTEAAKPLSYKFGKTVTYVTPDGHAIEASKIRKDARVRVHYLKDGDDMVVDKVILKRDRDETVQFCWLILKPS